MMQKKLISVGIVVILLFSIYGCGQTAEDTLATETATMETENTETESEEEADADGATNSSPEVEESVDTEDIQTEDTVETEDDVESGQGTAIYKKRYEEFQERISEARNYIAGKLPDTDISDEELPEGVCLMDLCEGDLDGDGKPDFAVVLEYEFGYEYFLDEEFGLPQEALRPIYVYTYAEGAGYQCRYEHPDLISAAGFGGMMGDSYAGMEITEGTLRVSDYGGSSDRWGDDLFFEIKEEALVLKEFIVYEGSTLSGNGMRTIWNYEEGTFETYALSFTDDPLLINRGTFEAKTVLFQEADMRGFQSISTVGKLPYLSYYNGYAGMLDDVQENAARYTAEEVLDIVREKNYPDMYRVDIVCEEEIFDNYETLLGYKPPRYYYEDDAGNTLIYKSQDITADHTHEVTYYGPDCTYCRYELSDETGEIVSEEEGTTVKIYNVGE